MLTMVVPLYISELSQPDIRGGLVVLQQLSITIGILASFWIDYGTHYIGGTRCAPDTQYTGGTADSRAFDPYNDVPSGGCTGQSDASWRIPLALQIAPALILGGGMFFYQDTPRWLLAQERDEEAFKTLSKLRGLGMDHPDVVAEVLDIKAAIILENSIVKEDHPGLSGAYKIRLCSFLSENTDNIPEQYVSLLTNKSKFRRLAIGCLVMFFQQFMGCNVRSCPIPVVKVC